MYLFLHLEIITTIIDTVIVQNVIEDKMDIDDSFNENVMEDKMEIDDSFNKTDDSYTSDRSMTRKYMSECPIHNHHMDGKLTSRVVWKILLLKDIVGIHECRT